MRVLDNLDTPSFGALLIAQRLGFGWSEKHKCFIKITVFYDKDTPFFLVSCVNCFDVFSYKEEEFTGHYKWWNLEKNFLDKCNAISSIDGPVRPVKMVVNMDGFEVYV